MIYDEEEQIPATRLAQRYRRARKVYTCDMCRKAINPGEGSWYEFWLVDGKPYGRRLHVPDNNWCGDD